jgi:hypothetical protein
MQGTKQPFLKGLFYNPGPTQTRSNGRRKAIKAIVFESAGVCGMTGAGEKLYSRSRLIINQKARSLRAERSENVQMV